MAFLSGDGRAVGQAGDDAGVAVGGHQARAADEDGQERLAAAQPVDVDGGDEAVDLAAEGVALDLDVHDPQERLVARLAVAPQVAGHEDHPRARAPHGFLGRERVQRGHQAVGRGQLADGRALAAGDDQAVEPVQILRQPHFHRLYAQRAQDVDVFDKGPLQGEDADSHGGLVPVRKGTSF